MNRPQPYEDRATGQPSFDVPGGALRLTVKNGMLRIYGYAAESYALRVVPESSNVVLIGFDIDRPPPTPRQRRAARRARKATP
jgi:hypothetical protein